MNIKSEPNKKDQLKIFEAEKQKLLKQSEISLLLDHYDDIFSDFDPRHYSERALSDDFLNEVRRASRDKPSGKLLLKFMVPKQNRNFLQEYVIKKRLRDHFKKHHQLLLEEIKDIKKKGLNIIAWGTSLMLIAGFINSLPNLSFFHHLLLTITEPAGWFLWWTGLDQFYYTVKQKKPELVFYEKFETAEISFTSY
ncbi:MAG: hypothetical protein QXG00_03805 [Candidatus Woesearchaeota archaeon]